jgi:DNA-binding transcriptional MerR regulator
MEKHRAIPKGFMTVGEVAGKMNTTVRTLQYYDKEGILSPSAESGGGRRLYTHKDIVKLHQILSMKYLGFSLEDIKRRIPSIDTPAEIANILSEQTKLIREKINSLKDVLKSIEKLNTEVLQMKTVDWEVYANILVLLQYKNDLYWAVKHFDGKILDHVRSFDKKNMDAFISAQNELFDKVDEFQRMGIAPESEQGQAFAKDFWDMVMEFTDGEMSLLPELSKLARKSENSAWKMREKFIEKALDMYLISLGYDNPFEGE